jgi:uncharacterized protein (DUF1330 family)
MKGKFAVALGMAGSFALGAVMVQGLHAQSKPLGYIIAQNTVSDPEGYSKDFAPKIGKTIQDAGGKFLVRGGKSVQIHGEPPAQRIVIVQFESLDKAMAWANSKEAKDAWAIGDKYGTFRDFAAEGVSQ